MSSKHIYIASDFHLGIKSDHGSRNRESKIIKWLDGIKNDAEELLLIGDIFDYWFEYSNVIPKGHVRFIGKIAELVDAGIPVSFYTGNHDIWFFDYFEKELGVKVIRKPQIFVWNNNKFLIGHGDGLGPGDTTYKMVKKIFTNKLCQWLYKRIHPDTGIMIMKFFSKKSRDLQSQIPFESEKERLIKYCEAYDKEKLDYFIFGHRHLPIYKTLSDGKTVYINSGDWLHHFSYIKIKSGIPELLFFESEHTNIYGD